MPNNFKLSGDYYVSKFGNDSWDGLTPDTPKRTIQAAVALVGSGQSIIVGNGQYDENLSKEAFNALVYIYSDGNTNIASTTDTKKTLNFAQPFYVSDVTFTRCNVNIFADAFRSVTSVFINCKFINCSLSTRTGYAYGSSYQFINCIFVNCSINAPTSGVSFTYSKNIFVNCYIQQYQSGNNQNNYYDRYSILYLGSTPSPVNYNNVLGSIAMNFATSVTTGVYQSISGRYFDLSITSSTGTGTLSDPYGRPLTANASFSLSVHKILYPSYNINSISEDPKFNNIESLDFSVMSDSPMIGRASDGSNIGNVKSAVRLAANSSSFSGSSATVDSGLTFSYNNYVISGSAVTGSVTSAPIFVSSSAKVIQEIDYNGLLAFNKTTSSFYSGSNVNVPDFDTYTSASGNPGANPDRLVYYMRLTTGSTQPVVDADWDNGNLWTRGDYNVFEWNTKPSIDIYGRGNGDPNFIVANSSFLRATYIQMKVKLRNDYLQ